MTQTLRRSWCHKIQSKVYMYLADDLIHLHVFMYRGGINIVVLPLFLSLGFISQSLALGSLDGPTGHSGADLGNLVVRQSTLLCLEDEIDERFSLPPKLVEYVVRGEVLEASFGVLCVVVHAPLAHLLDGGSDVLLESLAILLRVVGGGNLFVGHLP